MRWVLGLVVLAGCARPPASTSACVYAPLAHPTMTADELAAPQELRVRRLSEGAR